MSMKEELHRMRLAAEERKLRELRNLLQELRTVERAVTSYIARVERATASTEPTDPLSTETRPMDHVAAYGLERMMTAYADSVGGYARKVADADLEIGVLRRAIQRENKRAKEQG